MAKRKSKRRPMKRPVFTGSQEQRVCLLGDNGGYAWKAIAQLVFGKESDWKTVSYICRKNKVKVTEWRRMESDVATGYAKAVQKAWNKRK